MTVVIKLISAFLVCSLVLCENPKCIYLPDEDEEADFDQSSTEWTTSPSSDRGTDKPLPPCRLYHEYCTNPNATYKFQPSLKGKKISNRRPDQFNYNNYVNVRCFCDPDCHSYGDCCYDQLAIDSTTGEPIHLKDPEIRYECHGSPFTTIRRPFDDIDIMLVASCPSDYEDNDIIQRCQRQGVPSSQFHFNMDVPVVSLTTNRTYVNMYCAMCNSDDIVHRWNTTFHCPSAVPNCLQMKHFWKYVRGEKKWTIRKNSTWFNISYDIKIDTDGQSYYEKFNARKCRSEVIRDCPADWTDMKTRALCSAYSLLVRSKSNHRIYKNEHCALCNSQNRSQLACPRIVRCPVGSPMIPISIVVDFKGVGDVGRNRPKCDQLSCKFGEICNHIYGVCRPYTCGKLFDMNSEGKCVRRNDSEVNWSTIYLNDSCRMIHVNRPDYFSLPNNSIYVNLTSLIYSSNEHEVVNATTVLICVYSVEYNFEKFSYAQSIISTIGVSISLLCLAVHIFIYLFLPHLRNVHGMNVLSLSCCLFVAQSCFQFGIELENAFTACVAIGMTIHFGFLASFFWMNVMAIDIYRTFASESSYLLRDKVWGKYKKYALYAWLLPLVVVLVALINDLTPSVPTLQPNYGKDLCWINNRDALLIYLAGPLGLLLLVNMAFFWMTIVNLQKAAKAAKVVRGNSSARDKGIANDLTRAILYTKLAVIMGLTWIFGLIAPLSDSTVLWYVFIIFNSLQGAFIFLAFSCKRSTFHQVQERFYQVIGRERNIESSKPVKNQTQLTTVTPSKTSSSLETLKHSSIGIGSELERAALIDPK